MKENMFKSLIGYFKSEEEALASNKIIKYVIAKDGVYSIVQNDIGTFKAKVKEIKGGVKITQNTFNEPTGATTIKLNEDGPTYYIGSDGLYVRRNMGGTIELNQKVTYIQDAVDMVEGVDFAIPKIPTDLFYRIYLFFKAICKKHTAEVMMQIWLNKETNEYILYCPVQIVTGTHITYLHSQDLSSKENYLLVMDIHSHNVMKPIFSSIDDKDEINTQLYGVIGELDTKKISCNFRTNVGGQFLTIPFSQIFEGVISSQAQQETFPKIWLNKIQVKKTPKIKPIIPLKTPAPYKDYSAVPAMNGQMSFLANEEEDNGLVKNITLKGRANRSVNVDLSTLTIAQLEENFAKELYSKEVVSRFLSIFETLGKYDKYSLILFLTHLDFKSANTIFSQRLSIKVEKIEVSAIDFSETFDSIKSCLTEEEQDVFKRAITSKFANSILSELCNTSRDCLLKCFASNGYKLVSTNKNYAFAWKN